MDNAINLDLTIAIPVLNEEKNIHGCLEAIGNNFAKVIVLIDSGSSDKTKEIAQKFGVHIIDFKWDGKFPKKRNWFLREHTPKTKWILFLDADEYITPEFKKEVYLKLMSESKVGYWLNYTIYFLDKPLKRGYSLKKLALFEVGMGEYEKIEEKNWSKLDMEVHEHPVIEGQIGAIKNKIDHKDFNNIFSYINKHNEYSEWEAHRYLKQHTTKGQLNYTWKQKLKYNLITNPLIGLFYFIGSFIFMGGFLDGSRGFAFSFLKMSYFMQVQIKIAEKLIA